MTKATPAVRVVDRVRDPVFPFGENWRRFFDQLTPRQVEVAAESLRRFLSVPDLRGKRFLDVGCGSGLFSYAAVVQLGAAEVISVDADAEAVAVTRELWRRAGAPSHWTVRQGSVLDPAFVASLPRAEVVYAWGVLHHTGSLWEALDATARLVAPGGLFYLALYNRVRGLFGSRFWWYLKRWYVSAPRWQQTQARRLFRLLYAGRNVLRRRPPRPSAETYAAAKRGMAFETNVHDWLGGFPYDPATTDEVLGYLRRRFPSFRLLRLKRVRGLANNEYFFGNGDVRDHG